MIVARSGNTLLIGLDAMNLTMVTQSDSPIQIPKTHPAMAAGPVDDIIIDAAPTLEDLQRKWIRVGLLPPDFQVRPNPKPTKPRH